MTRTYRVTYKNKSKMLTTKEDVDATKKSILEDEKVKSVKITDKGQKVSIEAEPEDFTSVMNNVVNVFRRRDDKSEVAYEFELNH